MKQLCHTLDSLPGNAAPQFSFSVISLFQRDGREMSAQSPCPIIFTIPKGLDGPYRPRPRPNGTVGDDGRWAPILQVATGSVLPGVGACCRIDSLSFSFGRVVLMMAVRASPTLFAEW